MSSSTKPPAPRYDFPPPAVALRTVNVPAILVHTPQFLLGLIAGVAGLLHVLKAFVLQMEAGHLWRLSLPSMQHKPVEDLRFVDVDVCDVEQDWLSKLSDACYFDVDGNGDGNTGDYDGDGDGDGDGHTSPSCCGLLRVKSRFKVRYYLVYVRGLPDDALACFMRGLKEGKEERIKVQMKHSKVPRTEAQIAWDRYANQLYDRKARIRKRTDKYDAQDIMGRDIPGGAFI